MVWPNPCLSHPALTALQNSFLPLLPHLPDDWLQIKDAIAYLHLARESVISDTMLARIINKPARGLGVCDRYIVPQLIYDMMCFVKVAQKALIASICTVKDPGHVFQSLVAQKLQEATAHLQTYVAA